MATIWWHAITWTSAGQVLWCHMASPGHNELTMLSHHCTEYLIDMIFQSFCEYLWYWIDFHGSNYIIQNNWQNLVKHHGPLRVEKPRFGIGLASDWLQAIVWLSVISTWRHWHPGCQWVPFCFCFLSVGIIGVGKDNFHNATLFSPLFFPWFFLVKSITQS